MPKSSGRLPQDLIFENSDLAKPGSHIDDLPHLGDAARLDPNEQGLIDIDASTGRLDTEERPVVNPGNSNPSSGWLPRATTSRIVCLSSSSPLWAALHAAT